jgi:hypothetical protein
MTIKEERREWEHELEDIVDQFSYDIYITDCCPHFRDRMEKKMDMIEEYVGALEKHKETAKGLLGIP